MNKTLDWLKANVFIVIFAVLIIAAFIVLPLFSRGMNEAVSQDLEARKSLERDLTSLRSTGVALQDPTPWFKPPQQSAALVNPNAEEQFAAYVNAHVEEAERVLEAAEEFNRRNRSPLVADLYPEPKLGQKDIKIAEMSTALHEAYESLLERVGAGVPPSLEDMREELVRMRSQYIAVTAQKESEKDLTPEERAELERNLSDRRVALTEDAARRLKLYAGIDAINPPGWSIGQPQPTPTELFDWQWDYWAFEDVILALGNANANSASVVDAPVKRLISIGRAGASTEQGARRESGGQRGAQGGQGGPFLSGGGMDGSRPGGGSPPPNQQGQQQAPAGQTFDQAKATEVPRKFDVSFTGRATNPLYDVRPVTVHIVAQTDRIPEVLDAIASQNFMTITSLELWPADPYAALQEGYVYGPFAVSDLVLEIETVWLRSWTTPFMPGELKTALNIPSQSSGGSAAAPPTQ
jgi:hypothetical protein